MRADPLAPEKTRAAAKKAVEATEDFADKAVRKTGEALENAGAAMENSGAEMPEQVRRPVSVRHVVRLLRLPHHRVLESQDSMQTLLSLRKPWTNWKKRLRLRAGEPPLRAELFSVDQLTRHAKVLVAGHQVVTCKGSNSLLVRLGRNEDILRDFNRTTLDENPDRRMTPAALAKKAHGQVAIASAKTAYQIYKELFGSDRFKKLSDQGARAQRLLWASTGTKNPEFSDIKYIEALIGPDTVNTAPLETISAYRDHGVPQTRLEKEVGEAARLLKKLPTLGIDLDQVTQQLEDEGIAKFNNPFDALMTALSVAGKK